MFSTTLPINRINVVILVADAIFLASAAGVVDVVVVAAGCCCCCYFCCCCIKCGTFVNKNNLGKCKKKILIRSLGCIFKHGKRQISFFGGWDSN